MKIGLKTSGGDFSSVNIFPPKQTSFLLDLSVLHGLHKGHALIAPKLLVGLLGLRGLTCCCLKGLTIAVKAMAVQGVVVLVGTTVGLAMLANFSLQPFLGTRPVGPPDALHVGLLLASNQAVLALPFALSFLFCFSTMTRSIASRSSNNV